MSASLASSPSSSTEPAAPGAGAGEASSSPALSFWERARSLGRVLALGFEIDLRSLAVFRMGMGLVVLANVWVALASVQAFLTDDGLLPRTQLMALNWESAGLWSIHMASGAAWFQVLLLLVHGAAAVSLCLGYRTRLATILCWVLTCSMETRNPTLINGADTVLRLLLFWSMFLPLGAWWSMDRRRSQRPAPALSLLTLPGACLLLQVCFVYVFSAVMKGSAFWWHDANALQMALHLDTFATPVAVWLRQYDALCAFLTRSTMLLEVFIPIMVLLPVMRSTLRLGGVILFVGFHAGIAASMDIGAFPWIMMAVWLAFLPKEFWHQAARLLQRKLPRLSALLVKDDPAAPLRDGTKAPAPTPAPVPLRNSWAATLLAMLALGFIFMWNLRGTNFDKWAPYFPKDKVNGIAFAFRLDQHWAMFAPNPMLDDGWYIFRATLSDGRVVDLLRDGAPVVYDKPTLYHRSFHDSRWQKYLMNLWLSRYEAHRVLYGNYMYREWNRRQGALSQVVAYDLIYMMEMTQPDGTVAPVEEKLLIRQENVPPWEEPEKED